MKKYDTTLFMSRGGGRDMRIGESQRTEDELTRKSGSFIITAGVF